MKLHELQIFKEAASAFKLKPCFLKPKLLLARDMLTAVLEVHVGPFETFFYTTANIHRNKLTQ